MDNYRNVIYIYDYKRGAIIDSIDVALQETEYLFDYEVLDSSRIMLVRIPTYLGNMHDSAICIIDRHKNILDVFSFKNTPTPLHDSDNPLGYKQKPWWFTKHSNFPIRFSTKDSTAITVIAPFKKLACDSIVSLSNDYFAYKLSVKKNENAIPLPYKIPKCSSYYNALESIETAPYGDYSSDNVPVFGYSHSSTLFYNNETIEPKLHLYTMIEKHKISLVYKRIIYDKYRNCFWWVIRVVPKEGLGDEIITNYQDYYIVQLDPKLNVVSEGFLPKYADQYVVPLKSGLLIKDRYISDSLGKGYYTFFNPNTDNNMEAIEEDVVWRSHSVKQDFGKFIGSIDENPIVGKKYLVISLDLMPPNYAKLVKDMLIEASGNYKGYNVYIFTDNPDNVPKELLGHVHINRYSGLTRHVNKFIWPKTIEVKNRSPLQLSMEDYPSNVAPMLFGLFKTN
ncbi:MAG: hypothetical protein QM642_03900 [Edaphocola sp.]